MFLIDNAVYVAAIAGVVLVLGGFRLIRNLLVVAGLVLLISFLL